MTYTTHKFYCRGYVFERPDACTQHLDQRTQPTPDHPNAPLVIGRACFAIPSQFNTSEPAQ